MSTPDRLTDDGQANDCPHLSASGVDTAPIGPEKVWRCDHCGLSWVDQGHGRAARLAAQPPATDRDTLRSVISEALKAATLRVDDYSHTSVADGATDAVLAALAARPAPATLADRVQALADDLDTFAEVTRLEGDDADERGYESVASETVGAEGAYREAAALVRALLAGRSDASPEGGA